MSQSQSAGYSGTPLIKKLGIKPGNRVAFVHAPDHYLDLLGPLPDGVEFLSLEAEQLDFVHAFYVEREQLAAEFAKLAAAIAKHGMVWISWPKKASKVPTDITGNDVREVGLEAGLVDVKVAAVDAVWSGHKFVYRKSDR
ncbi:MAG: DUF3052 domain-containing protein [Anaerolineaceae bacterium]|nr:DUF3052 domain-containing protein [Anaerolineaceae bacterium]